MSQATADVLAMASLEVDLSKIEVGQTITVKWRGKPVFIRHRSEDDIASANNVKLQELRDPQSDDERVLNPEVSPTDLCCHQMRHLRAQSMFSGDGDSGGTARVPAVLLACRCLPQCLTSDVLCSGWSWLACAPTWGVCRCLVPETLAGGSALVTAATMMCPAELARAPLPVIWRCPSTSSWTTPLSWLDELHAWVASSRSSLQTVPRTDRYTLMAVWGIV